MKNLIERITQRWLLSEPPLFRTMCLFTLKENPRISCPVRIGAKDKSYSIGMESGEISSREKGFRFLEYNPVLLQDMSEQEVAEWFKCEMIRVLLKHPYERRPEGCIREVCALGSNILIGENYSFRYIGLAHARDYGLAENQVYEWYCLRIKDFSSRMDNAPGEPGADTLDSQPLLDLAEQWEEDQLMQECVNSVIRQCEESGGWGTMSGDLVERIKAGAKARINWQRVLSGFRASILSSRRRLSRMRPSRRFGFDQMGSRREFDTKLLVAMDVSGSISGEEISRFLGVINSSFRYGMQQIDVAQFDVGVTVVMTLKKAVTMFSAVGRGGTSFQPVIDYAVAQGYDGLVVLTDGYAEQPEVPHYTTLKIAWVCMDSRSYEDNREWMEKTGRVCIMDVK